jgi:diaminohydroxyphosphoribosylaminopyrimidine deaminase / 5-amino-6-(5-phosphoribosylamino)uracil reductase
MPHAEFIVLGQFALILNELMERRPLDDDAPARNAEDARFMALALALGRRGLGRTWPNPAVGAVIVKDGVIVGRGWTQPGGRPHAETQALQRAGAAARGATLYVTLEPCSHHGKTPPCADAIIAAGIARVVSALVDPNPEVAGAGHWRMAQAGVVVEVGLRADEARRAHAGHIRRVQDGRPHVTLKLAVSADGKAALAGRRPAVITGEPARAHVHLMRATSDAVLTGIGTVLADNPLLTCRLPGMRSPVRVVLDGSLRLPFASRLVATARQTPLWVVTGEGASHEREQALAAQLTDLGVDVLQVAAAHDKLDLAAVLKLLAGRGITRLMVETGPILATAFLRADLVDAAVLFSAPTAIGPDGIDALDGLPLSALTQSPRLTSIGREVVGVDVVETFERV